jgi:hypothetical protein
MPGMRRRKSSKRRVIYRKGKVTERGKMARREVRIV